MPKVTSEPRLHLDTDTDRCKNIQGGNRHFTFAKWAKESSSHFIKEAIQMVNKCEVSNLISYQENEIKTTMKQTTQTQTPEKYQCLERQTGRHKDSGTVLKQTKCNV